jgi:hypothetical protein
MFFFRKETRSLTIKESTIIATLGSLEIILSCELKTFFSDNKRGIWSNEVDKKKISAKLGQILVKSK